MEELSNLISAACIDQKIYLFQKNVAHNHVTVFYKSGSTLISQPLFQTVISPARVAVRDINQDGYFEMAVMGCEQTDFFRLSDETNIASWHPISSDQLACACLADFSKTVFFKTSEPPPPTPRIFPPLLFATVIMVFAIGYHPVKNYCVSRMKCLC